MDLRRLFRKRQRLAFDFVLLSPLLGLAELAKRSSQVKAGSEEFLANLDYPDYLERPKKLQQKWGILRELSRGTLGGSP